MLSYRWAAVQEDWRVSAWLLVFYERVPFMGFTLPESEVENSIGEQAKARRGQAPGRAAG